MMWSAVNSENPFSKWWWNAPLKSTDYHKLICDRRCQWPWVCACGKEEQKCKRGKRRSQGCLLSLTWSYKPSGALTCKTQSSIHSQRALVTVAVWPLGSVHTEPTSTSSQPLLQWHPTVKAETVWCKATASLSSLFYLVLHRSDGCRYFLRSCPHTTNACICACVCVLSLQAGRGTWWNRINPPEGADKALLVAAREAPRRSPPGPARTRQGPGAVSCFLCVSRLMPHQDTAGPGARRHGRTCIHTGLKNNCHAWQQGRNTGKYFIFFKQWSTLGDLSTHVPNSALQLLCLGWVF